MTKTIFSIFFFFLLMVGVFTSNKKVEAVAPVLNFSDITSGPATGNTDGNGGGAIVTVWGNNLGNTQDTSSITIGGQAPAHIYYWKNADGTLPGGPADLYTHHKMQEITFSIPSSLTSGTYSIQVTVNGIISNSLPFTVRSGNIYFVKTTGDDNTGDGSWNNPWQTLADVFSGNGKLSAGDIVYSVGVGSSNGLSISRNGRVPGTESQPTSLIMYPNTESLFTGGEGNAVIDNWWPSNYNTQYINFSKLSVLCYGNDPEYPIGFDVIPYGRIVGAEITGPHVYGGYGGAISGGNGIPQGGKYLGIYIHDYGYDTGYDFIPDGNTWTSPPYDGIAGIDCTNCTSTDRFQHLFYVSCRDNNVTCEGYEIGWCNLVNNHILHSLHIYDMGPAHGWHGTISLHDNYLENNLGGGIEFSTTADSTANIEVYNNVVKDQNGRGFQITETGSGNSVFYNNTIYNQSTTGYLDKIDEFRNNIMYDSIGVDFLDRISGVNSNNLYYSNAGVSQPSWAGTEPGNVTGDPLFNNVVQGDFSLRTGSPAIDTGIATPMVASSFFGILRPQGSVYDIGAYEYQESGSTVIRADVDNNSQINSTDAMLTLRNSLGLDMSGTDWQASGTTGDVNCDGNSNSTDAMLILRYSLGLDMSGTTWCVD